MDLQLIEWAGSLTGLAGSALLAANIRISKFGWWLFTVSNLFMIAFSLLNGHNGLLVQQSGFMVTSIVGIIRSHRPEPGTFKLGLRYLSASRGFSKQR